MRPARLGPPAEKSGYRKLRISMDIPHIYHVYTSNDIHGISMDLPRIYLVDTQALASIRGHGGISMDIPCIIIIVYPLRWISIEYPWIYHVYSMYIGEDGINMEYT